MRSLAWTGLFSQRPSIARIPDAMFRELEEESVDGVVRKRGLGIGEDGVSAVLIRRFGELVDQGFEVGVLIVEIVVRTPAIDLDIHGLGVGDDGEIVILAFEDLIQPLRPFDRNDLRLNPDFGKLGSDDLTAAPRIGGRRQLKGQGKAAGMTGLRKQRLCCLRIVGIALGQVDIGGVMGGEMAADRRTIAEHRTVDNCLPVDGMSDRLAHLQIIQRRAAIVDREDRLALGGADLDREARVSLELDHALGCWKIGKGIQITGHHRGDSSRRIRHDLERGALKRDGFAPIALIAHKLDPVALNPAVKFEGTGADRQGLVAVGALRRDDHGIAPAEIEEEMTGRSA